MRAWEDSCGEAAVPSVTPCWAPSPHSLAAISVFCARHGSSFPGTAGPVSPLCPFHLAPTLSLWGGGDRERSSARRIRERDRQMDRDRQRMTPPPWYSWAISPCPPPPPCPCGSWSCPGPWRAGGRAADETAVVSSIQAHFRNGGEDDVLPPPQPLGAGGLVEGQFHLSSGAWPESLSNGG